MQETYIRFKYGDSVIDTVTGFKGKVTAFCYYFNKQPCSYLVEGIDDTGRPISQWVDENRVKKEDE